MSTSTSQSSVRITESSLEDLRRQIEQAPGTVYAILDACDEPRVPVKVKELGPERAVCLYRGSAEEEYWAVAPYLVVVDEELLDWIIETLWNDPWGVFAVAETDLVQMRKHFRRFLIVQHPDERQVYFRYYDPRLLSSFLNTCTEEEVGQFFGPVVRFVAPTDESLLVAVDRIGRKI